MLLKILSKPQEKPLKPLTMMVNDWRERDCDSCGSVNKYAYINQSKTTLSIHHSDSPTLFSHDLCTWKLHIIACCEWRNTCSKRDYCTVNTQSSDVSCCGLSCHVHIAASSSLKVTLSVLHLTVVLCLLKSFVNTTWHGLSVSRSGCTRAHIHTHSIWAGEHNLSIVNQKFQYLLLSTWCAMTFLTNLLKCH